MTRLQSYSPEDLVFLKDQVSPGDQEGPKSKEQGDRERKKGMLWKRARDSGGGKTDYNNGKR